MTQRPKPEPIANDATKRYAKWLDRRIGDALNESTLGELLDELTELISNLHKLEPYDIDGTSHTVSSADKSRIGRTSSGSAVTITVNASHGLSPGHVAYYRQAGAGQITFVESGVTIHKAETLKTRKEGAEVALRCVDATNLDLTGDVELV